MLDCCQKVYHDITMDRSRLTQILHSIIIADALASPLDNLGAEHIHNVFGTIHEYTDPTPALKHKLHAWKKPGLYTALSQYCILLAAINSQQNVVSHQHIANFIFSLGDSSTIFRHPQGFLQRLNLPYNSPTTELLICIPTLFFLSKQSNNSIIHFILSHNTNAALCASSLFVYLLLEEILMHQLTTLDCALLLQTAENTLQFTHTHSSSIFANGGNPQNIIETAQDLYTMMMQLPLGSNLSHFTSYCLPFANKWSKNVYTRLTVNHPFALLPMALYCIQTFEKELLLYSSLYQGGKTSLLVPLVALIATALYGDDVIPKNLIGTIVNKKRILQLLQSLQNNSISMNYLMEFFQNEKKLTQKEQEELKSKLKHIPSKRPTSKKPQDAHKDMTQHVVESWTKLDKAKWKKERKKG